MNVYLLKRSDFNELYGRLEERRVLLVKFANTDAERETIRRIYRMFSDELESWMHAQTEDA